MYKVSRVCMMEGVWAKKGSLKSIGQRRSNHKIGVNDIYKYVFNF